MDAVLLRIDGTGPLGEADYRAEMQHSFVKYIVGHSPAAAKRYERGPAMRGFDMAVIAAKRCDYVDLRCATHTKTIPPT